MENENINFEKLLNNAMEKCTGAIPAAYFKKFQLLYPFTTENIGGYINEFDLKDKSLLTVGSSGDQVLNSILYDCKDITLLDINPYTKYYFYLKLASLLELSKEEFQEFFCYIDFPKVFKYNLNVFNFKTYQKISKTLRLLDYESYLFWNELLGNFSGLDIRKYLFSNDENRLDVTIKSNPYLKSNLQYIETREKVKKAMINFIVGDLFATKLDKEFDNIWLSNIGTYLTIDEIKTMVDKMNNNLKSNGKLLISYLYRTTIDTKYQNGWKSIYDLKETFNILKLYHPYLISFTGIDGLKFSEDNIKDSALIYKKKP